jgi:RNA polymerase sigma factor (sigma-70 family)
MSKNPDRLTDDILIQLMCGQALDRDKAFQYIFVQSGWRKEAMNRLQKEGVSLQNAKDAVQEAVITLDKHVRDGHFNPNYALKDYFFGICKGRANSHKRSTKRIDNTDDFPIVTTSNTPETDILQAEVEHIIRLLLNQLDDKCRDLLTHYMLSFSMKEIRDKMNITSDAMTRKMAHDCRKKLGELIDNNPTLKRYLKSESNT